MELILLFIGTAVVNNFVLYYFLGICPFLGVSGKIDSALSMGAAVTFVLTLTAAVTWAIQHYILIPLNIEFLQTIMFILVIASLVQFVEMFIKKVSEPLYLALGIFLPLITTNCCIMFLATEGAKKDYTFIQNIVFGLGAGAGFTLTLIIMASIREQLEDADIPYAFKGVGLPLTVAAILSVIFTGFAGLI